MPRPLLKSRSVKDDSASLILRMSLMMTLAILSMSADATSTSLSVTAAILGCLIGSGFLTRAAAIASIALVTVVDHNNLVALVPIAAEAFALVLVGAGAYSLDEFAFHRRLSEWSNHS